MTSSLSHLRIATTLAVLGATLALLLAVGPHSSAKAADSQSTVAILAICSQCVSTSGDLSRYQYVTLNAWNHDQIATLKARNPAIKVLVYKDMSSTRSYGCRDGADDALLPTGVGYCFANRNHPDWFTTDGAGNRIQWTPWPDHWQMDIGTQAYQDTWTANVLAELKGYGWDGVMIDNANVDASSIFGGRSPHEYPTQPSYQAATRSFLARVGPKLTAEGFLVLPNIQAHPILAGPALWADWIQFTSGGMREYWMKWGEGYDGHLGGSAWESLQQVFATVQRAGKLFLTGVRVPADDTRSVRYSRASFLLGWEGGQAGFAVDVGGVSDPWSPEWSVSIGAPTGPRYQVGSAWRRDFSGGTAIANISSSASQPVALGGTYLLPDGSSARSVTLPPLTGVVLKASDSQSAGTRSTTTSAARRSSSRSQSSAVTRPFREKLDWRSRAP